jgi:ATP-binding cassette subfamily B protein
MKRRAARLFPYIAGQWRALTVILALTLLASATTALQPWPMKILVDHALRGDPLPGFLREKLARIYLISPDPASLILLAAFASLALFVINSMLDTALNWAWAVAGQRMVYDLAGAVFARLQRLSLLFHTRRPVGDSISRLSTDTWCVYSVTSSLLVSPLQQVFTLATVGGLAWALDPDLSFVSFALAPLLAGSSLYFGKRMKRRAHQTREAQTRLLSFVQQVLSSIPLVQVFAVEDRNKRRFLELSQEAVRLSQRGALINASFGMVNGLITTAGMAVILFAGGQRVLAGSLSLGGLLVFLAYIRTLQNAAGGLLQTYGSFKPLEASIERVLDLLETPDAVADSPGAMALPPRPAGERGQIRFENVSFAYEPGRPVLKDVSFETRPGESIALVGATGAGKSTLVSLIPRFFDPTEGRILFDGLDVRQIRLTELREQISIVLQDPFLMPLTVAENIAYGRRNATREEMVRAAVAANAHDFIRRLPEGYDTIIGERGAALSGGQRQRIAIARALLKNAPVLILDEPTSALDTRSEALLLDALERLMQGRTCFIIAHRLSTIRNADRILVLEAGRIVETGTHQELLEARGLYCRLHSLQFEGGKEGAA